MGVVPQQEQQPVQSDGGPSISPDATILQVANS